jgi:hypothetical protein
LMAFLKYLQLNGCFCAQIFTCFWPEKYDIAQTKDLGGKNGLNSSDFDFFNWKPARFLQQVPVGSPIIEGLLKILNFHIWYIAKFG